MSYRFVLDERDKLYDLTEMYTCSISSLLTPHMAVDISGANTAEMAKLINY